MEAQDQACQAPDRVPLLLLISAPSGAGKTTLCRNLLARCAGLTRAVTCTTRPPRPGEINGLDYHFVDDPTFLRYMAEGAFIEHAEVYGYRYGVLRSELLDRLGRGLDVLLNVDVQGAATIRDRARHDPQLARALVTVFLCPPSLDELERRIRTRGTDPEDVIQRRLAVARREIAEWPKFDYLVVSGTVEDDIRRVLAIMEAERMRTVRAAPPTI